MIPDDFQKIMIFMIFIMFDLDESASHPLPLLEGVPQVKSYINPSHGACEVFASQNLSKTSIFENGSLFFSRKS